MSQAHPHEAPIGAAAEKIVAELAGDMRRGRDRRAGTAPMAAAAEAAAPANPVLEQAEMMGKALTDAAELARNAAERAAADAQAAVGYASSVSRGLEDFHNAWMHQVKKSFWVASNGSQELFQSRDLQQVASVQRKLMLQTMNTWIECSLELLKISSRIAEDASRTIAERGDK